MGCVLAKYLRIISALTAGFFLFQQASWSDQSIKHQFLAPPHEDQDAMAWEALKKTIARASHKSSTDDDFYKEVKDVIMTPSPLAVNVNSDDLFVDRGCCYLLVRVGSESKAMRIYASNKPPSYPTTPLSSRISIVEVGDFGPSTIYEETISKSAYRQMKAVNTLFSDLGRGIEHFIVLASSNSKAHVTAAASILEITLYSIPVEDRQFLFKPLLHRLIEHETRQNTGRANTLQRQFQNVFDLAVKAGVYGDETALTKVSTEAMLGKPSLPERSSSRLTTALALVRSAGYIVAASGKSAIQIIISAISSTVSQVGSAMLSSFVSHLNLSQLVRVYSYAESRIGTLESDRKDFLSKRTPTALNLWLTIKYSPIPYKVVVIPPSIFLSGVLVQSILDTILRYDRYFWGGHFEMYLILTGVWLTLISGLLFFMQSFAASITQTFRGIVECLIDIPIVLLIMLDLFFTGRIEFIEFPEFPAYTAPKIQNKIRRLRMLQDSICSAVQRRLNPNVSLQEQGVPAVLIAVLKTRGMLPSNLNTSVSQLMNLESSS